MSLIPRLVVCYTVALLSLIGLIRYQKWPPERYTPPPLLYQNATKQTRGVITGFEVKNLGDHLFEGSDTFYFEDYKFQPYVKTVDAEGDTIVHLSPTTYTGAVRIQNQVIEGMGPKVGDEVIVKYDPIDPDINGVPGTLGVWSKTTGYINPYAWYYVGVLVLGFVLQEIVRMITRTNDFR